MLRANGLFYGVFSAWVLWAKKHPPNDRAARFNWHEAAWSLHVPMIRALFEHVATPSRLGPLGLTEVLDWTGGVLNRVERATFFERFRRSQVTSEGRPVTLKRSDRLAAPAVC